MIRICKFLKINFFIILLLQFIACSSTNEAPSQVNKVSNPIEEIGFELISNIASKYYNFENKRVINIIIDDMKSNFDDPKFNDYLYSKIIEKLQKATQLKIISKRNGCDAIIQIHIIEQKDLNIKILLNMLDAKTNTIFRSTQKIYNINNFDQADLNSFPMEKKTCNSSKESGYSLLTIKAINKGDVYKARDKYYLFYGYYSTSIFKVDTGYSKYYAADRTLIINGKKYKPNEEKVFFTGRMPEEKLYCTASCRGVRWDAYDRRQIDETNLYSKDFIINNHGHDDLYVDVLFVYDGKRKDIKVQVYKLKKVYSQGILKEKTEIIEIF